MNFELLALLIFLFPLAFSPGPGNMLFAANGARFGFRSTIAATTGYHIATVIVTFALGFGFAKVVTMMPTVLKAIQVIGSLYVSWAAQLAMAGGQDENADAKPIGFWDGGIFARVESESVRDHRVDVFAVPRRWQQCRQM